MTEELRYPTGRFEPPVNATAADRRKWIGQIAEAPARVREAVAGLTPEQIETPYRPGGWTVRQVVHHLADSHINSYVRFRLALTEKEPAVKGYDENLWAQLGDAREAPVELSLALLDALHARWVVLLRSLGEAEWRRTFHHSEIGLVTLERNLALYAWHGRHHTAHITRLCERMGWR